MNLADLHALGVEVSLGTEGNVRLRAAPGVLTPQIQRSIAEAKPGLIEELRELWREPVNVVNMVNFPPSCLPAARTPSTASGKAHRASGPERGAVLSRLARFSMAAWVVKRKPPCSPGWRRSVNPTNRLSTTCSRSVGTIRTHGTTSLATLARALPPASMSGGAVTSAAICALASASSPSLAESSRRSVAIGRRRACLLPH